MSKLRSVLAITAGFLFVLGAGSLARAQSTCSFDEATGALSVSVDSANDDRGETVVRALSPDHVDVPPLAAGDFVLNGVPCVDGGTSTPANVANTATLAITGTGANDVVHLYGVTEPGFGDIATVVSLGGGTDAFTAHGGDFNDTITVIGNGIDVDDDDATDIATSGIDALGLAGGDGDDDLDASPATVRVTLIGGGGDDWLNGSAQDDVLNGGDGIDHLVGADGQDVLKGGAGNDLLQGFANNDTLIGGPGNDTEEGGDGNDVFKQTGIDDLFSTDKLPDGNDVLLGQNGADTVDYGQRTRPIHADLADESNSDGQLGDGEDDSLRNDLEHVIGGKADDSFIGNSSANTFNGNAGDDDMLGHGGGDTLNGGPGDDTLNGEDGNDTLNGGPGEDTLLGENGNDTLNGGDNADDLFGDLGDDMLSGGNGNDEIFGGGGDNVLKGNGGNDLMWGSEDGLDRFEGGTGDDEIYGTADGFIEQVMCGTGSDVYEPSDEDLFSSCEIEGGGV